MKIKNLTSPRGNEVPNQFQIETPNAIYLQSYDSIIAKKEGGNTYLDEIYWNYSKTTSKYRSLFLGESTKETQSKINNGVYILTDLNSTPSNTASNIIDFKFFK
jgi:hypothetical protein